ncbi:MAG: metal ABC transporter ATP-binding protein [Clostridiales bacterium]|jgi:zinc transport system ATP-binding protein|nr:metal ABC transporter ATP-binding protein [Clostridiales bacterium]
MALITCRDVSFSYDGNAVVSGLNFEVRKGDYLCVVGENGSGKSTLIKGLLGLKAPSSGEITIGDGLRRNEIGYLPQQTVAQNDFPASVREVVLSGRLSGRGLSPFYSREDKMTAEKNMSLLGIRDLRDKCYRELSGGQQRRALLARALCAAGKIALLDEPMTGLDPASAKELYLEIEKINREESLAIIMVSHDMRSVAKYAGRILHLRNKQEFFGAAEEYADSDIGSEYMGRARDD